MSETIDLTAIIAQHFADANDERSDERHAHVSDLVACDREVWARRNGKDLLPHTAATRIKFALGNAAEDTLAIALQSKIADGWELLRNVRVALCVDGDELKGRILAHGEEPREDEIVGHADYVLRNPASNTVTVVEVKSTTFFPRRNAATGKMERLPPTEAQYHYRMQCAAYAFGVGARAFGVLVVCRDSGIMAEFWYRTEDYVPELLMRAKSVLAYTSAHVTMPPAQPPPYADGKNGNWRCAYCRFWECERNTNQQAMVV